MYDLVFSDKELTTWALLRQTWSLMCKLAETRLGKIHMTPEKVAILWVCREHPGPLIPAELARLVSRESQSVTGLLNRMEREGLITRIPKRKGRPYTEVKLTDKGEKACDFGVQVFRHVIKEVMSPLQTEEFGQLQNTLRTLREQAAGGLNLNLSRPPSLSPEKVISIGL